MKANRLLVLNKETIDQLSVEESSLIVGGRRKNIFYYLSTFVTDLTDPTLQDDGGGLDSGYSVCINNCTVLCE